MPLSSNNFGRTASDLEQGQPVRMHMDPEGYQQIQEYIAKAGG
jgi:hypothetical protein